MSSSKLSNVEVSKENVSRPKRAKRKLYTNEISSPIDISGQVVSYSFRFLESKTVHALFNSEVFIQFEFYNGLNFYSLDHISWNALSVTLLLRDVLNL